MSDYRKRFCLKYQLPTGIILSVLLILCGLFFGWIFSIVEARLASVGVTGYTILLYFVLFLVCIVGILMGLGWGTAFGMAVFRLETIPELSRVISGVNRVLCKAGLKGLIKAEPGALERQRYQVVFDNRRDRKDVERYYDFGRTVSAQNYNATPLRQLENVVDKDTPEYRETMEHCRRIVFDDRVLPFL